jgi:hypothetical protein
MITFTSASRDPPHLSSSMGHRLFLDTYTSLHRTFKSESLANVSFFLLYNSAEQPSYGVFRSINFPRSSTKTLYQWTDTVILLFSERSSFRCIVEPDGGSWHPKCVMNNSTKKRSSSPPLLKVGPTPLSSGNETTVPAGCEAWWAPEPVVPFWRRVSCRIWECNSSSSAV